MKKIPLTQSKFALVDDADHDWLSQWKWCYHGGGYALRSRDGKLMHRLILDAHKGQQVDHANRNGLDNRRENLRFCDHSQNAANSRLATSNTSGYRGVIRHWPPEWRRKGYSPSWTARIQVHKKVISLGYYKSPESAAMAYNEAARKYFGQFAYLNEVYNA